MSERFVIVGASLAGLRAAQATRRAGYTGPLTLVGGESHLPYDRPPLSKEYLRADPPPDPTYHTEAELRGELDLDLRLGTWATALDPKRRVLELRDRTGGGPASWTTPGRSSPPARGPERYPEPNG